MAKTYLVTGGAGFIGSHLVKALIQQQHTVCVLDNLSSGKRENIPEQAELIVGDIRDDKILHELMRKVDGCFHLAAILSMELCNKDWLGTHDVNSTGTIHVFNAARQGKNNKPIPVIYASSCAVYGDISVLPLKETTLPEPITAYGADKLSCEHNGRVATLIHGVPTTGLRLFNIYGPGQDPHNPYAGVISKFLDHLIKNEPMEIFDGGTDTRDFVYVEDAVRFFIKSMEKQQQNKANIYNVATGKSITINALADLLAELSHSQNKAVHIAPRKGDIPDSQGDPSKAFQELGIKTEYSLKEGLIKLID